MYAYGRISKSKNSTSGFNNSFKSFFDVVSFKDL